MAGTQKISLAGSVSLGTGVMIGAGIFALVGQVAELADEWFPVAFVLGAVVAAVSSYAYIRYSAVNPSSGGIAMLLKDAYGPGVIAGSFSLFMYVSMVVAESLLARTFGTYLLRPFGLQDSVVLVPVLGVVAISAAAIANLVGNRLVERSALVTATIKIAGIAILAIAGLIGAATVGDGIAVPASSGPIDVLGVALLSLASWSVLFFGVTQWLLAFPLDLPIWQAALTLVVVINLGMIVPSTPAAIGVYHQAVIWTLSFWAIDKNPAFAFAVAMHGVTTLSVTLAGFAFLLREHVSLWNLYRTIAAR